MADGGKVGNWVTNLSRVMMLWLDLCEDGDEERKDLVIQSQGRRKMSPYL